MLRVLLLFALCGATLTADTIIGDLNPGPHGYSIGHRMTGQVFTVPTDNVLTTWQFDLFGWIPFRGFTTNIGVAIYDWTGDLTPPLLAYYVNFMPWPTTTGTVSLTGLDLPLVSGQTYITIYFTGDYSDRAIGLFGDYYSGGQAGFGNDFLELAADVPLRPNFDTVFRATFTASPQASGAPEPSSLALVSIATIIAAGSRLRRRIGRGT